MAERTIIKGLSTNKAQAVGAVKEVNLKFDATLKNKNNPKLVGCITKADFKNPSITVETADGNIIGFDFYPTYKMKEENGKLVENPRFKSMETIMNYEIGTKVKIDGSVAENGYATEQGEFKTRTQFNAFQVTSTKVASEDEEYAEFRLSGIIKAIKSEMKGEDETGRKIVDFYYTTKGMDDALSIHNIELVVEEDLVDDFEDMYSTMDRAVLDIEVKTTQVGSKATTPKFGKQSKIKSGYSKTEFIIIGGEEALEEENNLYIDDDTIKKLLKEREVFQKAEIDKKVNGTDGNTAKRGLGTKSKMDVDDSDPFANTDEEDNPFA